jgi:hypothetical protein
VAHSSIASQVPIIEYVCVCCDRGSIVKPFNRTFLPLRGMSVSATGMTLLLKEGSSATGPDMINYNTAKGCHHVFGYFLRP